MTLTFWSLLRARWYMWRITRLVKRLQASKPVNKLVIPAEAADQICELAIEYGEPIWVQVLHSLPRDDA